jgi:hypothetical protein
LAFLEQCCCLSLCWLQGWIQYLVCSHWDKSMICRAFFFDICMCTHLYHHFLFLIWVSGQCWLLWTVQNLILQTGGLLVATVSVSWSFWSCAYVCFKDEEPVCSVIVYSSAVGPLEVMVSWPWEHL